tara:strand:+ start:141 stop:320 length:180 start_codon:yes stop_codon:yes gene_type:complete
VTSAPVLEAGVLLEKIAELEKEKEQLKEDQKKNKKKMENKVKRRYGLPNCNGGIYVEAL